MALKPQRSVYSDFAQQSPPQPSTSNASLYPWSHRRLALPTGQSPFPRYGHAANGTSSKEGDVYIMGGLIRTQPKGDLWKMDSTSNSPQLTAFPITTQAEGPGPRVGHASLLVGNAFIGLFCQMILLPRS